MNEIIDMFLKKLKLLWMIILFAYWVENTEPSRRRCSNGSRLFYCNDESLSNMDLFVICFSRKRIWLGRFLNLTGSTWDSGKSKTCTSDSGQGIHSFKICFNATQSLTVFLWAATKTLLITFSTSSS